MMDDYPVIGYGVAQNQPLATPIPREKGGSYGFAVKKGKILNYLKCLTKA